MFMFTVVRVARRWLPVRRTQQRIPSTPGLQDAERLPLEQGPGTRREPVSVPSLQAGTEDEVPQL